MAAVHKHKYEVNLEEFTLVWLDSNVNKDSYNVEAQKQLRTYMNHLRTFEDLDECRKYIVQAPHNRYLVLITSGQLGQDIVSCVHHIHKVFSIYVFCSNKPLHEKWARQFKKVKHLSLNIEFEYFL